MIMLSGFSPFSSFIPWKRRKSLREYCACCSACASIFFKSSWRTDAWPSTLLIIFSLSSLLASNLLNFYERKLTVSVRSVSSFSPLIWFCFKVYLFWNILFNLYSKFFKQSKRILLQPEESKSSSKTLWSL